MPSSVYRLTPAECLVLGLEGDEETWLCQAPFDGRNTPSTAINWPLVERVAAELSTSSQALARVLLAARMTGQVWERLGQSPPEPVGAREWWTRRPAAGP